MDNTDKLVNDWLRERFEPGDEVKVCDGMGRLVGSFLIGEEWIEIDEYRMCLVDYDYNGNYNPDTEYFVMWHLINKDFVYKKIGA